MDMNTLGTAATAVVVIVAGAFTGWQSHRARKGAESAARNAYPISNGWGTKVAGDLAYLRERMDRAHDRMDENARRQNTTDQRLAQQGERIEQAASHARAAAEQSSAVAAGLSAHLADHAHSDTLEVGP